MSSSSEEELDINISREDEGEVACSCVPYQDQPFADTDESSDESDGHDEDGLSPLTLERRYNKVELVESWHVLKKLFLLKCTRFGKLVCVWTVLKVYRNKWEIGTNWVDEYY